MVFVGIQFFRPNLSATNVKKSLPVPFEVETVLRKDCYDCHSNETNLRWYDQIQPFYSLVSKHILEGRKLLNFSDWDTLSDADKKNNLYLALNQAMLGSMPLKSYLLVHPHAQPDSADLAILKNYLLSISPIQVSATAKVDAAQKQYNGWLQKQIQFPTKVKPTLNGIDFVHGFEKWQVIAMTDRFDNNSIRIIYGNDVAVAAIKKGNLKKWPDGTILAKAAWIALTNSEQVVRPGEFWQVEFMIKDSKKWAAMQGWGWARWRGTDLKPYGKDKVFTTECVNCHQPMKDQDYVFTQPFQITIK